MQRLKAVVWELNQRNNITETLLKILNLESFDIHQRNLQLDLINWRAVFRIVYGYWNYFNLISKLLISY